jgi:two-component system, LuxR family, response regulator FixJ
MKQQTLCLVDSDTRRRAAIVHGLSRSGIHVEPFDGVVELLEHSPREPDVIFAHDDGGDVTDLMDHLVSSGAWCPVVAYSESPEVRRVVQAVQNGVEDYLTWPFSADEVREAIETAVCRGHSTRHTRARENAARIRLERLTRREREVLARLANGLTNRGIAEQLQISPRTVEIHRANLLTKIHARHTSEAIRVAIEANLED